jgi:hypothetical protein
MQGGEVLLACHRALQFLSKSPAGRDLPEVDDLPLRVSLHLRDQFRGDSVTAQAGSAFPLVAHVRLLLVT